VNNRQLQNPATLYPFTDPYTRRTAAVFVEAGLETMAGMKPSKL
jgi:hypothetical protein